MIMLTLAANESGVQEGGDMLSNNLKFIVSKGADHLPKEHTNIQAALHAAYVASVTSPWLPCSVWQKLTIGHETHMKKVAEVKAR